MSLIALVPVLLQLCGFLPEFGESSKVGRQEGVRGALAAASSSPCHLKHTLQTFSALLAGKHTVIPITPM